MKILYITTAYPEYISTLPSVEKNSFKSSEKDFYHQSFSWADFWTEPMAKRGVEFWQITVNHRNLQQLWARDFHLANPKPRPPDIVIAQVLQFQPDVLFMDDYNEELLDLIRAKCGSIKLVATWTGSALAPRNWIKKVDITLSCAPEVVERLNSLGHRAEHMNHVFAPKILERLKGIQSKPPEKATFIGQLLPGNEYHRARIKLISSLIPLGLKVYSPPWSARTHLNFLKSKLLGESSDIVWTSYARLQYARRPACFGLNMYSTLSNSNVTLNVHADSSPKFASNMRLFEATGVGSCLLTDWKPNIRELFEPDHEIVTYKTADECREKLKFLLENPKIRQQIAENGQKRCLADHNIDRRADKMLEIFRKYL